MLFGEQEFEEGFILEAATLGHPKQEEKVVCHLFKEGSRDLSLDCQVP
jgi:hypothetical protein